MSEQMELSKEEIRRKALAHELSDRDEVYEEKLLSGEAKDIAIIKSKIHDPNTESVINCVFFINYRKTKIERIVSVAIDKYNAADATNTSTQANWVEFLDDLYGFYERKITDDKLSVKFSQEISSGVNINNIPQLYNYCKKKDESAIISELTNVIQHCTTIKEASVAASGEVANIIDVLLFFEGVGTASRKSVKQKDSIIKEADPVEAAIENIKSKSGSSVQFINGILAVSPTKGYPISSFRAGDSIYVKILTTGDREIAFLKSRNAYDAVTGKTERIDGLISEATLNNNTYTVVVELGDNIFTKVEQEGESNVGAPIQPASILEEEESKERAAKLRNILVFAISLIILVSVIIYFVV